MTLENEGKIEDEIDDKAQKLIEVENKFENKLITEILRCIQDDLMHYTSEEIEQYWDEEGLDTSILEEAFYLEGIRVDLHLNGWKVLYLRNEPIFSWIFEYKGTKLKGDEMVVEYNQLLRSYDDRLNHLQNNPPEI